MKIHFFHLVHQVNQIIEVEKLVQQRVVINHLIVMKKKTIINIMKQSKQEKVQAELFSKL